MYLKIKDNRITNEISVMNFKNILLSSDQHIDLQPSTCIVRSSGCDLKKLNQLVLWFLICLISVLLQILFNLSKSKQTLIEQETLNLFD